MGTIIDTDTIVGTRVAAKELGLGARRMRQLLKEDRIEGQFKINDDGGKAMWFMPSPVDLKPSDKLNASHMALIERDRVWVAESLQRWPELIVGRDLEIVRLRYGLGTEDTKSHSYRELALLFDPSYELIRQIINRALKMLRERDEKG